MNNLNRNVGLFHCKKIFFGIFIARKLFKVKFSTECSIFNSFHKKAVFYSARKSSRHYLHVYGRYSMVFVPS